MSGLDLARAARSSPDSFVSSTLLLACSGSVQPGVQREALDAGCDGFEGKPFDLIAFSTRVRALIEQHQRR